MPRLKATKEVVNDHEYVFAAADDPFWVGEKGYVPVDEDGELIEVEEEEEGIEGGIETEEEGEGVEGEDRVEVEEEEAEEETTSEEEEAPAAASAEEEESTEADSSDDLAQILDDMTVEEIAEYIDEHDINLPKALTSYPRKADKIAAIVEAVG